LFMHDGDDDDGDGEDKRKTHPRSTRE